MMNLTEYENLLHFMEKAKGTGVTCVLVFKPNLISVKEDQIQGADYPDLIASTTDDAEVIAAMLGNGGGEEDNG